MSYIVSVNRYKYSQQSRRKILKKLAKEGHLIFKGLQHKNFIYEIPNELAMEEYKKRAKK